ncbi:MAG: class I SAM-dependent methyltransferase [Calothrix sp. MO_167.B12]|nr:class I SAM-dependent methyltransferase [Calothrix sp. MO_167.B12]
MSNSVSIDNQEQYKKAVNHYLSPKRKDSVKTQWEEKFSLAVIGSAIKKLEERYSPKSLRVMDFGCGLGEGFFLVQNALNSINLSKKEVSYLGLDNSQDMVNVASEQWESSPNVNFQVNDFRYEIPDQPTDIYLSCGVPYSHLSQTEAKGTLGKICRRIKENKTQSLIVVDVLGRYSIEWITKWGESRWDYRMSFVKDGKDQKPMVMTCYYAPEIKKIVEQAAQQENCEIQEIEFCDRSIMAGRHTSTLEYNPHIPPYREVINSLYNSERTTNFQEILFTSPLPPAPSEVHEFFAKFSGMWNQLVKEAADFCGENLEISETIELPEPFSKLRAELSQYEDNKHDKSFRAHVIEPTLANYLYQLESTLQPGLGVGHTLIALIYVNGKN